MGGTERSEWIRHARDKIRFLGAKRDTDPPWEERKESDGRGAAPYDCTGEPWRVRCVIVLKRLNNLRRYFPNWKVVYHRCSKYACLFYNNSTSLHCTEEPARRRSSSLTTCLFYDLIFFSRVTNTDFTVTIIAFFIEHVMQTCKGRDGCLDGSRTGSAR